MYAWKVDYKCISEGSYSIVSKVLLYYVLTKILLYCSTLLRIIYAGISYCCHSIIQKFSFNKSSEFLWISEN